MTMTEIVSTDEALTLLSNSQGSDDMMNDVGLA